jgi:hypothetical protein
VGTSSNNPFTTLLRERVDDLTAYLEQWSQRSAAIDRRAARTAADMALERINAIAWQLGELGVQLVGEIQSYDHQAWQDSGTGPGYGPEHRHGAPAPSTTHRPWCTDHLSEDPSDPLTAGTDSCCTVVDVLEPRDNWRGVHITASQDPDQTEPMISVENTSRPMTVDEATRLYAVLRVLLDRVRGTAA